MLRFALLAAALALASATFQGQWAVYKHQYGKQYGSEEERIRQNIFRSNVERIDKHNEKFARGESTYYRGINRFTDMNQDEVNAMMNGMRIKVDLPPVIAEVDVSGTPSSVDWRDKGYVTDVKDQGQCGSCWAFSTTGSVEGQHFKSAGKLVSLSESNLVDCSKKWGNQGCRGGFMDWAFQYIIDNKGIDTEESYPYKPQDLQCQFKAANVGATLSSYVNVTQGSESALQTAVADIGPISIGIDAGHESFQQYKGGVYDEPNCSSTELDHGVLAVGYGVTSGGVDYWIVKNSWSADWGDKGYIKMSRNKNNQCGVATMASYPQV